MSSQLVWHWHHKSWLWVPNWHGSKWTGSEDSQRAEYTSMGPDVKPILTKNDTTASNCQQHQQHKQHQQHQQEEEQQQQQPQQPQQHHTHTCMVLWSQTCLFFELFFTVRQSSVSVPANLVKKQRFLWVARAPVWSSTLRHSQYK